MPFEKGRTKTGGRTKGTPNLSSLTLRESITHRIEQQFPKVAANLEKLEPKDRINTWIKLLEFALPRLQRNETTLDLSQLSESDIDALFERAINSPATWKTDH